LRSGSDFEANRPKFLIFTHLPALSTNGIFLAIHCAFRNDDFIVDNDWTVGSDKDFGEPNF